MALGVPTLQELRFGHGRGLEPHGSMCRESTTNCCYVQAGDHDTRHVKDIPQRQESFSIRLKDRKSAEAFLSQRNCELCFCQQKLSGRLSSAAGHEEAFNEGFYSVFGRLVWYAPFTDFGLRRTRVCQGGDIRIYGYTCARRVRGCRTASRDQKGKLMYAAITQKSFC